MGMVVTVVTENVVVQVSDVQLTSVDDGKPLDEKQRKSAVVIGTDAASVNFPSAMCLTMRSVMPALLVRRGTEKPMVLSHALRPSTATLFRMGWIRCFISFGVRRARP